MISSENENSRYKKTEKLIRFAISAGMTQTDIAEKCDVHQSTVSNWKSGNLKATRQQIHPLLEMFGHKLSRKASKVYWSPEPITTEYIELSKTHVDGIGEITSYMGRTSEVHSAFQRYFFRVEGKVILSFSTQNSKRVAVKKLVVHHHGEGTFRIVELSRLFKTHDTNHDYLRLIPSSKRPWILYTISDPVGIDDLLKTLDQYADRWISEYKDAFKLPMKIRKSLFDNGFLVDEVKNYPDDFT